MGRFFRPNLLFIPFIGILVFCPLSGQAGWVDGSGKNPELLLETAHFRFVSHYSIDGGQLRELANLSAETSQKILDFSENQKPLPKFVHYLYPSTERKGLDLKNTEQAHVDFEKEEVHTVVNETYRDNFIGKENELVLRTLLGKPRTLALERGLAIYFTQKWQKKGYAYWAVKLFKSGNMIPLSEILDEEFLTRGSRLLTGCLTASFVEFALAKWGKGNLLENYAGWVPTDEEIAALEREWHKYLGQKSKSYRFGNQTVNIPYLKGFNFSHEGYRIYNGYGSRKATESLQKLVGMGANAIALVPYGYMRDPKTPSFLGVANRAGSENDESVIHAAAMAKKLGMTAMLKPQLWLHFNSWPGDVEMGSDAEWRRFFHFYHHWIAHYALLAEIQEIPILCVGVEFEIATTRREGDWRRLIRQIRGLYSGKLTYAANWGHEFERVPFWDELDYIGLDCYYPLSQSDNASKSELKRGFQKAIQKIEKVYARYRKPLIFTEIGFRSMDAPWKNPYAGSRHHAYNGEHQKRCYEAVFESIQNKKWCQGILWWKFPSNLDFGSKNGSYSPNNKPAEAVVRRWFQVSQQGSK